MLNMLSSMAAAMCSALVRVCTTYQARSLEGVAESGADSSKRIGGAWWGEVQEQTCLSLGAGNKKARLLGGRRALEEG
jgi:hypothetical protein